DGTIRDRQTLRGGAVGRSPHPGAVDRLLLRRLRRGGGGVRDTGGHLRRSDDGGRLQAAARGRVSAPGQHVARRLWRSRYADPYAGQGDRTQRADAQRDGGLAATLLLTADPRVAGLGDGRLAGRARRLAGAGRLWRQLRPGPVPDGELSRSLAGRRPWGAR